MLERREQEFQILSDSPDGSKSLIKHVTGERGIYNWLDGTNQPVDDDVTGTRFLWSPDGVLLVVHQDVDEKQVVIWDTRDAKASKRLSLPFVRHAQFSPDGSRLFIIQNLDDWSWPLSSYRIAQEAIEWSVQIPAGWDHKLIALDRDRLVICDNWDYVAEIKLDDGQLRRLGPKLAERTPLVSNPSIGWASQSRRLEARISPNSRYAIQDRNMDIGADWQWVPNWIQTLLHSSRGQQYQVVDTTNGRSLFLVPLHSLGTKPLFSRDGNWLVTASGSSFEQTRIQTWDLTRSRERWISLLVPLGLAGLIVLWRKSRRSQPVSVK